MSEVNALFEIAAQLVRDRARASQLWVGDRSPNLFELTILATRLLPHAPPAPSTPDARKLWLVGIARRLGLVPWPDKTPTPARKIAIDFYQSRAWRVVRYKVLKKYGGKCMCCGSRKGPMHVDHIKPRSKYPQLALVESNLAVLCEDCNIGKGAWDQTDWRPKIARLSLKSDIPSDPPA